MWTGTRWWSSKGEIAPSSGSSRKGAKRLKSFENYSRIQETQLDSGISVPNPQQLLPLPEFALEAHALRYPKRRDHATFDCLAALSGSLARGSKFPPRPVEVSRKGVMLARLKLGEQLPGALLNLGEFHNERLAVHIVIFHDIDWVREQFLTGRPPIRKFGTGRCVVAHTAGNFISGSDLAAR